MRVVQLRRFALVTSISTGSLASQANDYVSISVLKIAMDAQTSLGEQLVGQLQPQPAQPSPSRPTDAPSGDGQLLDVYA